MAIKETFKFDHDTYRAKLRDLTPEELQLRESRKYRQKVSSGWSVSLSVILAAVTFGGSLLGTAYSSRRLHIARRKEQFLKDELDRRNLPYYVRRKRDIAIPIAVCTCTLAIGGVVDLLCMGLTSSSIASVVSDHGIKAIFDAMQHSDQFVRGFGHGITLQAHQLFTGGGQVADMAGQHTDAVIQVSGTSGAKALASSSIHENLATLGGTHAGLAHADQTIIDNAVSQNSEAAAVGLADGFAVAQAGEKMGLQQIVERIPLVYCFMYNNGKTKSQLWSREALPSHCAIASTNRENSTCQFCSKSIDLIKEVYYHCCGCLEEEDDDYNICDRCCATLGCGCGNRDEHLLNRIEPSAEQAEAETKAE